MPTREQPRLEICILAGGLSTRMGRDKSRMKLGDATMLARIRPVAMNSSLGLTGYANARHGPLQPRIRVLRRDAVPRCGPLGGIVTALRTARARGVLFLACDMPLVTPLLLRRLFRASADGKCPTFVTQEQRAGFPLLLPVEALAVVEEQIRAGEFSLQSLAKKLDARFLLLPARCPELENVNTPDDAARASRLACFAPPSLRFVPGTTDKFTTNEAVQTQRNRNNMAQIKFGTDGWRAIIAEDFTFANVDRVAQATAEFWKRNPVAGAQKHIVIGYDRRFLSDQFAKRTAEVMLGNGFSVTLTSVPTPTPAVSFAVKAGKATGGVMITASHNPPSFNGFKLKAAFGGSAEPATCQAIEKLLDAAPVQSTPLPAKKDARVKIADIRADHFKAIKKLVDFKLIAKSKVRFAHDALFGVGAGCFEELLAGTTCRVTTLNGEHDCNFGGINPEPIPKNYAKTKAYLQKHPHDLCLVTDGDADRVGGMDGRGNALSTHQLICLLLRHYFVNRGARGRMIKALTCTSMVDKMCAAYGLPLVETGVGFKYIAAEMIKGDYILGAEESGGIGFQKHIPERDGILAGLMLLEMLATEKTSVNKLIAQLEKDFGPHRYARIDTHFPLEKRAALMEFCKNNPPAKLLKSPLKDVKSYDGVKFVSEDGSWLMLRGSGTEPILRIYAEAPSDKGAASLLQEGVKMTKRV